ncbi:MAG: sigma-70 family RNA polymerase sigma factor [Acidobacteriota bacterium]
MPLPPDTELVARLKAGDEALFEEVVAQYQRSLRKVALTWVRTAASAEEVVQDTWLAVVRGLPAFEGRSSFKTWLFTILANRARTRAVGDSRLVPLSTALTGADDEVAPVDDHWSPRGRWAKPVSDWRVESAEYRAMTRELADIVEAAVESLPDRQRAVVVLRDIEGVDAAAACAILGISTVHQRVLLHRGRTRVRAALERRLAATGGDASRATSHAQPSA